MTAAPRWLGLPLAALVAVGAVVGVQLANGGGTYEPLQGADPCIERDVTSRAAGIDGLTEQLVLIGLGDAACTLGVTREALTLQVARADGVGAAEIDALRTGLLEAVSRLDAADALPPVPALLDEALDSANLNGLLEGAIRLVPDSVVDAALTTDDVLVRAIDELDLRAVLADLDSPDALEQRVTAAVTRAVVDALLARLRSLF